ncbi:DUF362 domain-containing protein [candidate division KSB1 bacterium]|nr:DUF362 domain-containing protein [candidate division KSB1 bacterium]
MKKNRIFIKFVIVILMIVSWLYWDISRAEKNRWSVYKSYKSLKEFDTVTSATTKVSIVRSDDPELSNPISVDETSISYAEIEDMVRRAIELAGGFDWVIQPGDIVLLKPNIVDPEPPGSGEVTDVRVIKALIKIIDEIDHGNMQIVVGEGAPREMNYELPYSSRTSPRWTKLWDVAGYQDLLEDPYLKGINLRLSNLNGSPPENPWQDLVLVDVPHGGEALPQGGQYYIHKDVLDADVFITVPVMKIHNPGMTVALKNQIGLAPSTRYGFSKTAGVPQDGYSHKLIHTSQAPMYWTDKEIVDLCNIAQINYAVVDAIACLEREKSARRSGNRITNLVRMNTIVAGTDPVAVDHVCARLMGLNPDDIEHITLAEKVGLGTNNPDNIQIVGADLELTRRRFIKHSSTDGDFGQGVRTWLLRGPFSIEGIPDPINHEFIGDEANVTAIASHDHWSEAVYFTDDRVDLRDYFGLNSSDDAVSYAFCFFHAPKDQKAELWIGSDEALIIYINGEEIYRYAGTRSFKDNEFVSEKVMTDIKAGENRLLIKSLQKYGRYDFCLNICAPESDPDYDGNRIWGLKFYTESGDTRIRQLTGARQSTFTLYPAYPNPFNSSVKLFFSISKPEQMSVAVYNVYGQRVRTLFDGFKTTVGDHFMVWDGTDDQGALVSSGMYLLTVQGPEFGRKSRKVLFLR